MRSTRNLSHRCGAWLLAALLWCVPESAAPAKVSATAAATSPMAAALADYRRQLAAYTVARRQYEAAATTYWNDIAAKRRLRNAKRRSGREIAIEDYVLTQPPVYTGPPRPPDPTAPIAPPPRRPPVPVIGDFLACAARHFNFVPQLPASEIEYKRAYAAVAAAAGLTREQAVRIYGFESGGSGKFDVQAGLEQPAPGAHAISTALGYNQLLATNTLELLAEKGERIIAALRFKATALSGAAKEALEKKIVVVKMMVDFSRSVPDDWYRHDRLANTPRGLGIHALNLDVDVGPLLQAQKLEDSIVFARARGYAATLTAAELEMMNLTGDGNGLDMVMLPAAWREKVPTANFFQPTGYARNPVASRHNVVAKLLTATDAVMDREAGLPGAKDMAALFGE